MRRGTGCYSSPEVEMGLLGPGRGKTFFVGALLLAAWITVSLAYLVHGRSQSIFLGYQIAHARAKKSSLFEESCQLQIEARIWQTPERLQLTAARDLGLKPPSPSQARFLPEVKPHPDKGLALRPEEAQREPTLARPPGERRGAPAVGAAKKVSGLVDGLAAMVVPGNPRRAAATPGPEEVAQ